MTSELGVRMMKLKLAYALIKRGARPPCAEHERWNVHCDACNDALLAAARKIIEATE